ncbi:MAG: class I SAM-dependent methyltransferase [Isosphaeraceae bacterium]|nr:class I SAM-dependent methyltransferase [Isosphaeraceae bacterium]
MLTDLFLRLTQSPTIRRSLWRTWYDFLAARYPQRDWSFMNYGYHDPDLAARLTLDPADEPDRLCIQLYHRVVDHDQLQDADLLEVGSGRGGGAAYLARTGRPRSVVGVDLSHHAVALAAKRHALPGLRFLQGEADKLPLESASIDQVINVESSHCYPSRPDFFREVARVLRPGGSFRITDLFAESELAEVRPQLLAAGFAIESEHDITAHVSAALDASHDAKETRIQREIGPLLGPVFRSFAGLRGTRVHESFRDGRLHYILFSCRSPRS